MSDSIIIYTDGSSLGNPGPGGYGIVLKYKELRKEESRGYRKTTNNRMELKAVIESLKMLKTTEKKVIVYTDSQYVSEAINKDWISKWIKKGFRKVKNPDLWRELILLLPSFDLKIYWIKGHSGSNENERCDMLARQAAANPFYVDEEYEKQIQVNPDLFSSD